MTAHSRKLKIVTFTLAGVPFQCQLKNWIMKNGSGEGTRMYTFCADGDFIEDTEPVYNLDLKFFSDWTLNGISDYMWTNDLQVVAFQLDHLPDIVGEHVRWSGNCKIIAPDGGGDVRTTEESAISLPIIGKPTYLHL